MKFKLYFVITKKCKVNKNLHKKTSEWNVRKDSDRALGEYLGEIKFNRAWRQFCFYPDVDTIWSKGCLELINNFLEKANKRHRNKLRKKKK